MDDDLEGGNASRLCESGKVKPAQLQGACLACLSLLVLIVRGPPRFKSLTHQPGTPSRPLAFLL